MQCTIYMTTPYPGLIQELQYKVTYVLVERDGHAVHYIYDSSLSWLDTITSVERYQCLSGMRWSYSALYI